LAGDSIYYNILKDLIVENTDAGVNLSDNLKAKNYLTQSSLVDISKGCSNQFQLEMGREKVTVNNYNGLSEWQHFNGI